MRDGGMGRGFAVYGFINFLRIHTFTFFLSFKVKKMYSIPNSQTQCRSTGKGMVCSHPSSIGDTSQDPLMYA